MKKLITLLFLITANLVATAQILQPAQWSYNVSTNKVEIGAEVDLIFNVEIDRDWYLYSSDFDPECGPMVTTFAFNENASFETIGAIKPIGSKKKFDEIFECEYTYFRKTAQFKQTIKILQNKLKITGEYEYQVCTDVDGKCIPFDDDFDFSKYIKVVEAKTANSSELKESNKQNATFEVTGVNRLQKPANWSYDISVSEANIGDEIDIIFSVEIDPKWYLYSSDFDTLCLPTAAQFNFYPDASYKTIGAIKPIGAKRGVDETSQCEYTYFRNTAQFNQTIKVLSKNLTIKGSYDYQVCSDVEFKCIPFDDEFDVSSLVNVTGTGNDNEVVTYDIEKPEEESSLWGFMVIAFLTGLAALVTPCVFPMIPMTVTFFMKDNEGSKGNGIKKGITFGVSIVLIYTLLGTLFAFLLGADGLNAMATHWLPNIFIFIIFIIFALSFLGLFEITLPSAFVNKVDQQADRGGLVGVFFMAFTLALVSFSCTVPIVGSVLVLSAGGELLKPILGMLSFSMAFALPFTLFAIFPGWLKGLPKSGGWLNSVKVMLGFLELALGLKFLSVADQAYHWGLLDREIYLAFWIVIFTMMGFYLLGKIILPHDSKLEKVGVFRLLTATVIFTFVVYLIPGMFGAPLKMLAGYLPPQSTHDFDLSAQMNTAGMSNAESELCDVPMYANFLHFPHGLTGYFEYKQALACAKEQNKPIFIDFTGHGCVNCREMEARVWSDPTVLKRLKNDFVMLALYVDDKTKLPKEQWYTSEYDGKVKKTIGKQNADFQITRFQNNAQPYYIILDPNEKLLIQPKAYDLEVASFVQFLDDAKEAMKQ